MSDTPRNAKRTSTARKIQKARGGSYTRALREADAHHRQHELRPGDFISGGTQSGVYLGDDKMLSPDGSVHPVPAGIAAFRLQEESDQAAPVSELLSALGIPDIRHWNPEESWKIRVSPGKVIVPVGWAVDANGEVVPDSLVTLNLAQSGLLQGMTGSGKSTVLRELVLAACATHSPDRLSLLLVDYKGSVTFRGCELLPQVVDNLPEHGLYGPSGFELISEYVRRETQNRTNLFDQYHVSGIEEYQRARGRRARNNRHTMPAMPSLIIIVDESHEYMRQRALSWRELMDQCRSRAFLGIHLVLSDQQADISTTYRCWTEQKPAWGLSLKVRNPILSSEVVDTPEAASLPVGSGDAILMDRSSDQDPQHIRVFNIYQKLPTEDQTLDTALIDQLLPLEGTRESSVKSTYNGVLAEIARRNNTPDAALSLSELDLFDQNHPNTLIYGRTETGTLALARNLIQHLRETTVPEKHQAVYVPLNPVSDIRNADVVVSEPGDWDAIRTWWGALKHHRRVKPPAVKDPPKILAVVDMTADNSTASMHTLVRDMITNGPSIGVSVLCVTHDLTMLNLTNLLQDGKIRTIFTGLDSDEKQWLAYFYDNRIHTLSNLIKPGTALVVTQQARKWLGSTLDTASDVNTVPPNKDRARRAYVRASVSMESQLPGPINPTMGGS